MCIQIISFVVALNQDRVIGKNNSLPWHIPEDLKHFKAVTLNKPIVMGRKTFESINRVLPFRRNIVLTTQKDWNFDNVEVYHNIDDLLKSNTHEKEICIIGGSEIFKQFLHKVNKLYLTVVDYHVDNPDVFFPIIDLKNWRLESQNEIISSNQIKCLFYEYGKI